MRIFVSLLNRTRVPGGGSLYALCTISDGTALLELPKDAYRRRLTQFLFSSAGAKFRLLFRFDEEPSCTDPAPDMVVRVAFVLY